MRLLLCALVKSSWLLHVRYLITQLLVMQLNDWYEEYWEGVDEFPNSVKCTGCESIYENNSSIDLGAHFVI